MTKLFTNIYWKWVVIHDNFSKLIGVDYFLKE